MQLVESVAGHATYRQSRRLTTGASGIWFSSNSWTALTDTETQAASR
jgi:hypothetical protein